MPLQVFYFRTMGHIEVYNTYVVFLLFSIFMVHFGPDKGLGVQPLKRIGSVNNLSLKWTYIYGAPILHTLEKKTYSLSLCVLVNQFI